MRLVNVDALSPNDFYDCINGDECMEILKEQTIYNEWIPIKRRLPKARGCKIPCFVQMKHRDSNSTFRTMVNWDGNNECWKYDNGKRISDKYEILAWQRVIFPEPYVDE